jgi:formate hydrogenlyase subunit 3/multisubunit Na+/H+ antiporter MnhD subunit
VALLICGIGLFARPQFPSRKQAETRAPLAFWTLLLAVWGALNVVFLGGDLFNLYVALELLTFAAVPLVCLDGRAETLVAALRYLLFALFGSILYLLGAVLLYGAYGTLDIVLLSGRIHAEPAAWTAISLMTAGLLAKAALYPLHLWLPPAHAGAPAPASAILSGLVVKAPFFLVVRLWFDVMPRVPVHAAAQVLGALGAAAIIFGSVLALRQGRLKLLIAYSTVAQIGYLFLMFPLAGRPETGHPWSTAAWTGGVLQAISHAFAKAAMFMAAGLIAEVLGHDRIARFAGIGRALPITVFAFGLGGLSLMGLPPSGGFVAKAMLLTAAVAESQWWWALVVLAGGLLAGGYVFLVLARALADSNEPLTLLKTIPPGRQTVVLALALCAVLLGFVPLRPSELLQIGRPDIAVVGLR